MDTSGVQGVCHICHGAKLIKYCPMCKHWLCDECRFDTARIVEFFKEVRRGRVTGCCGPVCEAAT